MLKYVCGGFVFFFFAFILTQFCSALIAVAGVTDPRCFFLFRYSAVPCGIALWTVLVCTLCKLRVFYLLFFVMSTL
jgi:hypothetical protein